MNEYSSSMNWSLVSLQPFFIKLTLHSVIQLFFDAESDFVVIGLEDSPVISGDVKVRFESRSVSIKV